MIAELARVDPTNPLASPEAVRELQNKYFKLAYDNDNLVARATKAADETKTD